MHGQANIRYRNIFVD